MSEIHPTILNELQKLCDELTAQGDLPSTSQLQALYDAFRRKFGPEVLRSLNGEVLLESMHAHGSRDSLVYWLEFKDDAEFPARFGSIAGGSALKFGVYKRKETGAWATHGKGKHPKDIPVDQAVEIAERHRDQLLAAVDVLSKLRPGASDDDYIELQATLNHVAPDVADSAWGHKYLALVFPDRLDDFHVESFQRYHLVRLLELPPIRNGEFVGGRYAAAGRFVALAGEMELPLHNFTTLVNRRHGQPLTYWRIGTTDDETHRRKYWPMMRDEGRMAIGWPAVGDLSWVTDSSEAKEKVADLLRRHYGGIPQSTGRLASQLVGFVTRVAEGDRVLAADSATLLGVGEVVGPYEFAGGHAFPHQRAVTWRSTQEWRAPTVEGLRRSLGSIKDLRVQVEAERRILDDRPQVVAGHTLGTVQGVRRGSVPRLQGTAGVVQAILERKGQAILYGPPGTGKTYWALATARDLAAWRAFGRPFADLDDAQRVRIERGIGTEPALVRTCTFHPEYGYEDFIEGYRPQTSNNGELTFAIKLGIFRIICRDAAASPHQDFFLLVDEINRGDVPRIFGELLMLLERDKRGLEVILTSSGEAFHVPRNGFVIGTMNTADRSIALLDIALRRRFGFVELMPDYTVLQGASVKGLPLGPWLEDLNRRLRHAIGTDARNRQIGHAFLLDRQKPITTTEQLAAVLRDDIVPLLEEYCYDDFDQLVDILGSTLVDIARQSVRREYFHSARAAELITALMRTDFATAAAAVMATEDSESDPDSEQMEEGGVDPGLDRSGVG